MKITYCTKHVFKYQRMIKVFFLASFFFFVLGCSYYSSTYQIFSRFTNMSELLSITSILVFLMGLISEQIPILLNKRNN